MAEIISLEEGETQIACFVSILFRIHILGDPDDGFLG